MLRRLERLEEYFLESLLAIMTLVTFAQVVARYVFNYSFVWALEFTDVIFAWFIFIGASYGVRTSVHIGIDALVRLMGPTAARWVGSVAAGLCVLYSCILAVGGWQYVSRLFEFGVYMQDLPIQQWVPKVVLPIGFALLALRFFIVFLKIASGTGARLLGDEAEDALKLQDELGADAQGGDAS